MRIIFNNKQITRVIIDQHYREKHADSINDQLILELIKELDGQTFPIEEEHGDF